MSASVLPRIMMISTHGYVSAEPELGKPDTGGQVVYILELAKCLAGWVLASTSSLAGSKTSPPPSKSPNACALYGFLAADRSSFPRNSFASTFPSGSAHVIRHVRHHGLRTSSSTAITGMPAWPDRHSPIGCTCLTFTRRTRSAPGTRNNMQLAPDEMERRYNFRRRIRDEKAVYDECDVLVATTPQQREVLLDSEYDAPPR